MVTTYSICVCVCFCVYLCERDTDFPFWNLNIPISSLPLFELPSRLVYLSLLSQTRERSPSLWSRLLPTMCARTADPYEPLCSLDLCFSPSSSLNLSTLLHLCVVIFLSSPCFVLGETRWGCVEFLVKCPVSSMTSSAVVLCQSAWGLPLKPKAALEEASDGFCPLFHSLAFIPLCSYRLQGRFLTSMLFRQWCHGHGDLVLCLRLSCTGREKTQNLDVVKSGLSIQNMMTVNIYIIDCLVQLFLPNVFPSLQSVVEKTIFTWQSCDTLWITSLFWLMRSLLKPQIIAKHHVLPWLAYF